VFAVKAGLQGVPRICLLVRPDSQSICKTSHTRLDSLLPMCEILCSYPASLGWNRRIVPVPGNGNVSRTTMYLRTVVLACCLASSASTSHALAAPVSPPASRAAALDASPAALNPDLKYPTLADYEKAIKEPALMLDSIHIRFFAPKRWTTEANVIFPCLVRAYDELYKIVGVHTRYKLVVYHFPKGTREGFGGTSGCTIWYNYGNFDFGSHDEWKEYRLPHVRGYIEEMAHNFVDATHAQFGWEIMGWTIGTQVAQKVAGNPALTRHVQEARQEEKETFQRYVRAGYVFPRDIEANLCDRIHGWILYQAEQQYGPGFWPDFFANIRRQRDSLAEAAKIADEGENRNTRYRITVDCFDKLGKVHLRDALRRAHVSVTTDIKALHPTDPSWDRHYTPPAER
jgi:hypothetical protein